MSDTDCFDPGNETPRRAMREALDAIDAVHRAFGAPGDYGSGRPEGDALRRLYDATRLLVPALDALDAADAELSEASDRRIVACVNALEGIPTGAIEGGLVVDLFAACYFGLKSLRELAPDRVTLGDDLLAFLLGVPSVKAAIDALEDTP